MKNILVMVLAFVVLVSCDSKKNYKDEDYKQKQIEYEKKKAELTRSSGEFYKANKQKLMDIMALISELKDTTKKLGDISKDTSFYKSDVQMIPVNFGIVSTYNAEKVNTANSPKAKVFFTCKDQNDSQREVFESPLKELETSFKSNNDAPALKMKEEDLQTILDFKYVFVVDDIIKIEPEVKGTNEFESGLYIGHILCYDLLNKKKLYSFVISAQSSNSVSSMSGGLGYAVKRDFESNIMDAIKKGSEKHFYFISE